VHEPGRGRMPLSHSENARLEEAATKKRGSCESRFFVLPFEPILRENGL
jgi:hypothetical protein